MRIQLSNDVNLVIYKNFLIFIELFQLDPTTTNDIDIIDKRYNEIKELEESKETILQVEKGYKFFNQNIKILNVLSKQSRYQVESKVIVVPAFCYNENYVSKIPTRNMYESNSKKITKKEFFFIMLFLVIFLVLTLLLSFDFT
jgi:Tfp pilus assembly protein PilN